MKQDYHESQNNSAPQFTAKDARQARVYYQHIAQIVNLIINRLIQTIDKKHADAFTPSVFQTIHALHGMFNGREVSEKKPLFRAHIFTAPHFGFRDRWSCEVDAVREDATLSADEREQRIKNIRERASESAGRLVGRRLSDLKEAETACGRRFFVIVRADGVTQKHTSYEGHPLLDAAERLYFAARQFPNYAANPSKAITTELLDEAIASLPVFKPDGKVSASGERAPMDAGDLMSDAVLKGMWTKIITATERTLIKEFDCGGDPELVAAKYAAKIVRIGKDIKQRLARERLRAFYEMSEADGETPENEPPERETEAHKEEKRNGKYNGGQYEGGNFEENDNGFVFYPDNIVPPTEQENLKKPESSAIHPDNVVPPTPAQPVEIQQVTKPIISETAKTPLEYALEYAAQGIAVFPLHTVFDDICSCRKGSECKSKGKHPRWHRADLPNGVDNASTDPAQIKIWWERWKDANLAIAMGGEHRLIALDSDPRNGGDASVCDLAEAHGNDWFDTYTVRTGGNGNHFLYRLPHGVEVHRKDIAPGVDVKAAGGYLVAPPSVHASGRNYEVINNVEIAVAPDWLIEELTRAADVQPSKVIDFQERSQTYGNAGLRFYADGERNNGLLRLALGRWAHAEQYGINDANDLFQQVREARETRCAAGKEPPPSDAVLWDMVQRTTRKFARGERVSA
jgi:hypothetical protein